MAAQAFTKTAHCSTCGEPLRRIVAGNIIDFQHGDGGYACQRVEVYRAA